MDTKRARRGKRQIRKDDAIAETMRSIGQRVLPWVIINLTPGFWQDVAVMIAEDVSGALLHAVCKICHQTATVNYI